MITYTNIEITYKKSIRVDFPCCFIFSDLLTSSPIQSLPDTTVYQKQKQKKQTNKQKKTTRNKGRKPKLATITQRATTIETLVANKWTMTKSTDPGCSKAD